jgi:outer membrane receptor protein involved in Fe transport
MALITALSLALLVPPTALAQTDTSAERLDAITVIGRRANLIGSAVSASEGEVGPSEIAERPRLRPGDLVEYVPGMVATQHSGSGKANQYFLRGFNLDHGTDFSTEVDGMPVNLRSHGHGQGYSDLNFLIPELIERIHYRKGTYYAEVGDFSSAGSARFEIADGLPAHRLSLGFGEAGYARGLSIGSFGDSSRTLTYGLELMRYSGAWSDIDEDVRKRNLVLKAGFDVAGGRAIASVMSYRDDWNSPDQIPSRAVAQGLIDRLGSLDRDLGGASARYSLALGWQGETAFGESSAQVHSIDYELDLWSNFTYVLDDPENGDEFRQRDRRRVDGLRLAHTYGDERFRLRVGLDGQRDHIDEVGLCRSVDRRCRRAIRDDRVSEDSLALWTDLEWRFDERWRAYLGWRHDRYDFDVRAIEAENSGQSEASISSPKASLVYTPGPALEWYASWGRGFHSNDARGTTLRIDPVSGEPADPVTPLAASEGSELGLRYFLSDALHVTLAIWQLDLESELLYVGDAGTTEANRPSEREGAEFGLYWFASERFGAEFEAQYTDARFADDDPAGRGIPGAVPLTLSAGLNARFDGGWSATLRWRHVGRYPLIEDNSVKADGSDLLNLRVGRTMADWQFDLEVLNLLDSEERDIEYFYASRLPGEDAEGVEDRHFHAFEPRALRLSVSRAF